MGGGERGIGRVQGEREKGGIGRYREAYRNSLFSSMSFQSRIKSCHTTHTHTLSASRPDCHTERGRESGCAVVRAASEPAGLRLHT
eukprot:2396635-Rhodomonas_salina.2